MNDCTRQGREITDILDEIIQGWQLPVRVNTITDNSDGTYTLLVDKTYYLQFCPDNGPIRNVTIDSVVYEVVGVEKNESIKIKGDTLPSVDEFILPPPFFFHGTIIQKNAELELEESYNEKTPMVYLRRPFSELRDADDLNDTDIAATADLTLYFLTYADFSHWLTEQHDKHAVHPMRNMAYEFIELIKSKPKYFDRLTDYNLTDMIRFGVVTPTKGYESGSLWSDTYSGVELIFNLGIKYKCLCPE